MTYNTHYMYVPNDRKPAFKQHLLRMQPASLLILDDPGFAVEMNRALPKTNVIYRKWYPPQHADGDNNVHTRVHDPRELLYVYSQEIPANEDIYFHYGNEPSASDDLFDWSEAAARYTEEARRWGAYCNFSVGTPEQNDWRRASAQRFLRRITGNRSRHILALHEYIPTLVNHEFGLSSDPATWPQRMTQPSYLIGRYRYLFEVCKELAIPRPRIILTEFGFDFIHAVQGWQNSLPKTPGHEEIGAVWANIEAWIQTMPSGWTWPQYMIEQMNWCWRAIYRHDGIEGICIYCYGSEGRWAAYDHKDVPDLFPLMESKDWSKMAQPTPTPTVTPDAYINATYPAVNVRSSASTSSSVVRTLSDRGELVKRGAGTVKDDGTWYQYTFLDGTVGYCRNDVHDFAALKPSVALNVPYKAQYGDSTNDYRVNDCAAACIAMLMGFEGVDITVDEVSMAINQPEGTVHFKYIIPAVLKLGFKSEVRQAQRLTNILRSLNEGKPMMTLVNYEHLRGGDAKYRYGHFVVPIGYKLSGQSLTLVVHDPYNKASMEFPASRFVNAIADMNKDVTGNTAFQSLYITGRTTTPPTDPPPSDNVYQQALQVMIDGQTQAVAILNKAREDALALLQG